MSTLGKQKLLKQINRKVVLNLLRQYDEISIAELSQISKLSKPTIMKVMKYYIGKGYIVISGKGNSTEEGGKKPNIFKFNANGGYSVGMAITANKLKALLSNLKGEVVKREDLDLLPNEELESVIDKISFLYNRILSNPKIDNSKVIGLAVGIYGLTDFDKGVVFFSPHYPSWGKNVKMREMIQKKIPDNVPIVIDNISRFQVYAESIMGAAKNLSNIVSISAGYGLGSGIIIENDIKRGAHKIMGEVGHMVINPAEEMLCACGARGCFEVMVSIDRLIKIIENEKDRFPDSSILKLSKNGNIKNLEINDIFEAYNQNDELVSYAMDDIINWFAVGLSNIILIYDPQVIVIHGIYTQAGDSFLNKIRERVEKISLTSVKKDTKIRYSELGEVSGVIGAATYIVSKFFE
jgi:predicted NBD/HSP70 family sugar kinase